MKRISLRNTPIVTSALGFGCASLTLHDDKAKAVALLDEALALGVTHFDVAPLYGFGQAEGILGDFAQGKRDRLTITTKFGLEPPAALAKHKALVNFVRKVSHRFKFVSYLSRRAVRLKKDDNAFSPERVEVSLDRSLRELRTDYVDCLELHECEASDARNDSLITRLNLEVQKGRIRCYGIGLNFTRIGGDAASFPREYSVMQFDSSASNRQLETLRNRENRGLITFSVIREARALASAVKADPAIASPFVKRINSDLSDASVVGALMLQYAAYVNPEGISLFSTTSATNLHDNIRGFNNPVASPEKMIAFAEFASSVLKPKVSA